MEAPFEVPNLDGYSTDPADLHALGRVLHDLAWYATIKASAMRTRAMGRVDLADDAEKIADGIYQRLPDWARW
jgi:hypothetical protein